VRADPEPYYLLPVPNPESPVVAVDPHRVNRSGRVDPLVAEARVIRIVQKGPVRFSGSPLDLQR
jgi:hypothetical protein